MAQDSPQVVRREDDYLACLEYANRTEATEFAGIVKFSHSNGKNYFSWIDEDGSVILRSEGYPSESGRDNGAASVNKNREIEERYSVEEKFGKFFAVLKAGNHQEIARSCAQDSEEAARSFFSAARSAAKAAREAAALAAAAASASAAASVSASNSGTSESNREEDNYLACKEYARQDVASDHSGLYKFQHESGEYYFTWTDGNGNVLMRSESYPTTAARDNGLESVAKNREIEARFKIEEVRGYYFVVLKAGNHQEIARSCAYRDKAALAAAFPTAASSAGWAIAAAAPIAAVAASVEAPAEVVVEAPVVEAVAEAPAAVVAPEPTKEREDDYLACAEYRNKPVNDKQNNVALFKHENGQFYFVMYNANGSVKLRSEGFESAKTRDEELSGVLRYHDNPEMYTTIERAGHVLHILKDKTGREVGRSCLEKIPVATAAAPVAEVATAAAAVAAIATEVEVPAAVVDAKVEAPAVEIAAPVAAVAAAVTAAAVTIDEPVVEAAVEVAPPAPPKVIVEDDYLLCREYEGHTVVDKDNNIAFFKHANGQLYFVVYNADGSVRLRSEGFETAEERDVELAGVVAHLNNSKMYTRIDKGEYHIMVLKDETGREVGRSCMQKEAAAAVPVAPIAVAAVAAAVTAAANIPTPKVEIPVPPVVDVPYVAPIAEAVAEEGGFKWWWLLPLLLLPLMWLMCGKCKEAPAAPKTEVKSEPVKPVAPTEPVKTKLGVKQFLPVTLYFDNDQPDANTKATRTAKTYSQAYNAYYPLRNDFGAKGDGKATVDFFDNDVKKGMTDLEKLAAALLEITKAGEKVNLSVRGFASPLAKNDYNQALTGRRVSSIENYLNSYSNGALAAAMKSGAIKITTIPSGEEKAKGGVSDNSKDKKSSVYSVDASRERRVEIVGIE